MGIHAPICLADLMTVGWKLADCPFPSDSPYRTGGYVSVCSASVDCPQTCLLHAQWGSLKRFPAEQADLLADYESVKGA